MRTGLILMAALAVLMVAGALPGRGGSNRALFTNPVFLVATAGLAVSLLSCTLRRRRLRQLPFLLSHLGVVLILAGGLARFVRGEKYEVTVPVTDRHQALHLRLPDGTLRPLGFALSVTAFSVDFYDPVYRLVRAGAEDVLYTVRKGDVLDLGPHGRVAAAALEQPGLQGWKPRHELADGTLLECRPPPARHYEARLAFRRGAAPPEEAVLAVNHPVRHGRWWFHLQSYDPQAGRYVVLAIKHDPGLPVTVAGIWMLMAGTTVLCFRRRPEAGT